MTLQLEELDEEFRDLLADFGCADLSEILVRDTRAEPNRTIGIRSDEKVGSVVLDGIKSKRQRRSRTTGGRFKRIEAKRR